MKRFFKFTWYENKIKIDPPLRRNIVVVSNASEDIGEAAKAATGLFTKGFGNLKKNTIVSIQELDKDGFPLGEIIKPQEDSAIVPYAVAPSR